MIIKKSVKYPIIYNMGYLAIQSFLLYNLLLFAVHGLGKTPEWGNAIYSVVWSLNAIMAIFIIKFSDKWGYKESLIIANICQIIAFILLSMATVPTFIVGSSIFGAGACLAVSQNYVVLSSTMTNDYKGRYNVFLFSYACMNASAFAAGIISGFSDVIGFSNVFLISGGLSVLMLIFTSLFYTRTKAVEGNVCFDLDNRSRTEKAKGFYRLLVVAVGCSVILMVCMLFADWVNLLVLVALIGVFIFLVIQIFIHHGEERKKIVTFTIIMLLSLIFWCGYNIYSATGFVSVLDTATKLHGFAVQDVLSVDPLIIIILGITITIVLTKLEQKGIHINGAMRCIIGLLLLGVAFCIPVIGFHYSGFSEINVWWMILTIAVCGLAEIFIGPVGQAIAGQCATKKLEGVFIALGFVVIGGSSAFSTLYSNWMLDAGKTITERAQQFSFTIGVFAVIAFVSGIILLILYKLLVKWGGFTRFKEKVVIPSKDCIEQ
jgi:proton-dependent oligopeptide transporter, POT family